MSKDTLNNAASGQAGTDAVQTWLGSGYGVVVVAIITALVAPWIMEWLKGRFSTKLETHKLNLKRAEMLFEREVLAGRDFIAVHQKLQPTYTPNCDDHESACNDLAQRFQTVESELKAYLLKHAVVISEANRKRIGGFIWSAGERKFEMVEIDDEPSKESIKLASEILTGMQEIEDSLIAHLRQPQS